MMNMKVPRAAVQRLFDRLDYLTARDARLSAEHGKLRDARTKARDATISDLATDVLLWDEQIAESAKRIATVASEASVLRSVLTELELL